MADRLEPTKELVALLVDVDARRVLFNEADCSVQLELPGDDPADVSNAVWLMEQAGWCYEPADTLVWALTDQGREVMNRGAS